MDELIEILFTGIVNVCGWAAPDNFDVIDHRDFIGDLPDVFYVTGGRKSRGAKFLDAFENMIVTKAFGYALEFNFWNGHVALLTKIICLKIADLGQKVKQSGFFCALALEDKSVRTNQLYTYFCGPTT